MLCLAALTPVARACSCFRGDPRDRLAAADGAFIGVVTRRDAPPPGSDGFAKATYHFKVEERFKGDIGDTVEVETNSDGAACGLESGIGDRLGLLLDREGEVWHGGLCGTIDPDELRNAAAPFPKADGSGPLAFLVSGNWGEMRTVGLDTEGRTLHYGEGDGQTTHVSVCPGSTAAAEIVLADSEPYGTYVVMRDLNTFKGIWKVRIARFGAWQTKPYPLIGSAIACRSPEEVLLFGANNEADHDDSTAMILRVRPGGDDVVWEGGRGGAAHLPVSGSTAYVVSRTLKLVEIDVETGAVRDIAEVPGLRQSGLALGPDGHYVASLGNHEDVYVVDVRSGEVTTARMPMGLQVLWASNDRLIVTGTGGLSEDVTVLDTSLHRVGGWKGWGYTQRTIVSGGRAYGMAYEKLVTADPLTGGVKKMRSFGTPELVEIAAVPPRPAPAATPEPSAEPSPEPSVEPTVEPTPETAVLPQTFSAPTPGPAEPASSSSVPAVLSAGAALALAAGAFTWRRRTG